MKIDEMKKASLITRIRNRLKDKGGQSTTEYILILAIVVMVASKLKPGLESKMNRAMKVVDDSFDKMEQNNN
jgi:hypothetical protein